VSGTFYLEVDVPLADEGKITMTVHLENLGAASTENLDFVEGMVDVMRRMAGPAGLTLEPTVPALEAGDDAYDEEDQHDPDPDPERFYCE
jgi:hypothetical protein